jgi:hypothetical protein
MIERKECLARLVGFRDKHIIKIITGIRRCTKKPTAKAVGFSLKIVCSGKRSLAAFKTQSSGPSSHCRNLRQQAVCK